MLSLYRKLRQTLPFFTQNRFSISYKHLKEPDNLEGSGNRADKEASRDLLGPTYLYENLLGRSLTIVHNQKAAFQPLTATSRLIDMLFRKEGQQLRTTNLKSNITYSLTPELIAHLNVYLETYTNCDSEKNAQPGDDACLSEQDKLNQEEATRKIYQLWKASHYEKTESKLTEAKFSSFLNTLRYAKRDWLAAEDSVESFRPETLLVSYLIGKAETSDEIKAYYRHLNDLGKDTGTKTPVPCFEDFTIADLTFAGEKLSSMRMASNDQEKEAILRENYQRIMACQILKSKEFKLPRVSTRGLSFQGSMKRPNCVETAFQNLVNILLFDPEKNCFDRKLLPPTLTLHPDLAAIYEQENNKVDNVDSEKTAQAFFNLLSGNVAGVAYRSDNCELNADTNNFLPVMRHCFGSKATSLEELSYDFSTDKRKVLFVQEGNDILISITREKETENLRFKITPNLHAQLIAARFESGVALEGQYSSTLLSFAYRHVDKYPLFFPVLLNKGEFRMNMESFANYAHGKGGFSLNELYQVFVNSPSPSSPSDIYVLLKWHFLYLKFFPEATEQMEYYLSFYCLNVPMFSEALAINAIHFSVERIALAARCKANFKAIFKEVNMFRNDLNVIKAVVAAGADPNCGDQRGDTQLHLSSNLHVIKFLLQNGANPEVLNNLGRTALDCACALNQLEKVETLVAAGMNVNKKNGEGLTSISYASNPKIVDFLIANGAAPPNDSPYSSHYSRRR